MLSLTRRMGERQQQMGVVGEDVSDRHQAQSLSLSQPPSSFTSYMERRGRWCWLTTGPRPPPPPPDEVGMDAVDGGKGVCV